jgi:hypothetical protein
MSSTNIADLPINDLKVAIEKNFSCNTFLQGDDKDVDASYNKKYTMHRPKEVMISLSEIQPKKSIEETSIQYLIRGNLTCMQFSPMFFIGNRFKKRRQVDEQKYFSSLHLGNLETYSNGFPTITFQYTTPIYDYDREQGTIVRVDFLEDDIS